MREEFNAQNPDSMKLRFHSQTAGSSLTAQQIDTNVPRVTLQALAAVLGGTQSLHTNAKDEALALPTEESVRLALRTQQVIAFESGVTETVDPLAGSYYVESLTNEIETRVKEYLSTIDAMGGSVKAIEQNYFQTEIVESAYKYQRAIDEKEKIIVGVNEFVVEENQTVELLKVDESIRDEQIAHLKKIRSTRNNEKVNKSLIDLKKAASGKENVIPYLLRSVEEYASVGEISDALREVWGVYE